MSAVNPSSHPARSLEEVLRGWLPSRRWFPFDGDPERHLRAARLLAGAPVRIHTANGIVQGWRVTLDAVRVGDVEVAGVEAIVAPQPMPYVLLGNSFIGRFSMRRDSDQMVLEKRY